MGRVGWIGIALLVLGAASSVAWGLNRPPTPSPGLVVVTANDCARAALVSFAMAATLFGVVLIAARKAEPIRWGRVAALFFLTASLIGLAFQGPEIVASALGRDRRWATAIHEGINGIMLLTVIGWQVRDALARRSQARRLPSG